MNSVHSNLEQLIRDDAHALQMADEGCPNESTISRDMQNFPAINLSKKTGDFPACCLFCDLQTEIHTLKARKQRIASKTLLKTDDLRIVLTVLRKGVKMPEHHADARISLQILSGAVRLTMDEDVQEMPTGMLISLEPSVAHAIEALEPSALLMTMAWPTTNTLRSIAHRGYS